MSNLIFSKLLLVFLNLLPFTIPHLIFSTNVPYVIQNVGSKELLFTSDTSITLSNLRHFWYLDPLPDKDHSHYLLRSADPSLFPTSVITCEIRVNIGYHRDEEGQDLYQLYPLSCNGSKATRSSQLFMFASIKGKTLCLRATENWVELPDSLYKVLSLKDMLLEMEEIPVQVQHLKTQGQGLLAFDPLQYKTLSDFGLLNATINGHPFSLLQVLIPLKTKRKEGEGPLNIKVMAKLDNLEDMDYPVSKSTTILGRFCLEIEVTTVSGVYLLRALPVQGEGNFGCLLGKEEIMVTMLQKVLKAGRKVEYASSGNGEKGLLTFPRVRQGDEMSAQVGEEVIDIHVLVGGVGLGVGIVILIIVGYMLYVTRNDE